ncbi:MAG: molybdopterin molybdotransferase MoeA [Deltaproteobacteria bacterium]|nr:molybdopterin molybdotransferase MoeA [Deltaproteobacteria bacterium]
MDFFRVQTTQQVKEIIKSTKPLDEEDVALEDAAGRILAEECIVQDAFPPFDRSAMDGYAVQAQDTFGASESNPTPLEVLGEVRMGERPSSSIQPGGAIKIATGGMLPEGADAVVMVEHTQVMDEHTIQVLRGVAPGENVIHRGEDLKEGEKILEKGHLLRPQDLGALAALGKVRVRVYRRPQVGIISSGDEIVPLEAIPKDGEIRDTNRYTLWALIKEAGGIPFHLGIASDDLEDLQGRIAEGLSQGDVVLISGGSSIGTRDFTVEVIESLPGAQILLHGVAVSPGKPTILAKTGEKMIWGLPGHPVSAMVIFMILVAPALWRMGGRKNWETPRPWALKAQTSRNIPSAQGREDYVRVKLREQDGMLIATPIFGKSGSISTMVKGDGLLRIAMESEGVQEGEEVEVWPF